MGEGKRSRKKCLAYVALFVVFQTAVITVFALTVMKIKSPKVRFNAMAVENFFSMAVESSSSKSNNNITSVDMSLLTQIAVKNTNFGHFKYDDSTLVILYNGVPLGDAVIPRGRARAKKTKKFEISVDVSTDRLSGNNGNNLLHDINSGRLRLSSQAKLEGKVHLMKVIKKKKSGEMNCDWDINLANRQVENLNCK